MPRDWQMIAAEKMPVWQGDLDDRCTALWAGLVLHARLVHRGNGDEWLCDVEDEENGVRLFHSADDDRYFPDAKAARDAAEDIARGDPGMGTKGT
jgi:hypothetical protein